ncbi:hypothetical protein KIN20_015404 [Parelaphostrongylus tenuis]|uniref:Uncharacterized protein n=1 Tax=Parelaphostrongylus tenuis TaxID=148309 RepID=A0AAD5QM76_PARTN|nr:hypothetical protein KIN20_015404 [Parelaphostrongylus tenuis]
MYSKTDESDVLNFKLEEDVELISHHLRELATLPSLEANQLRTGNEDVDGIDKTISEIESCKNRRRADR